VLSYINFKKNNTISWFRKKTRNIFFYIFYFILFKFNYVFSSSPLLFSKVVFFFIFPHIRHLQYSFLKSYYKFYYRFFFVNIFTMVLWYWHIHKFINIAYSNFKNFRKKYKKYNWNFGWGIFFLDFYFNFVRV